MPNLGTEPKTSSKTENVTEEYGKENDMRNKEKIIRNTIHSQGRRYNKESKTVKMEMDRTYDKTFIYFYCRTKWTKILMGWQCSARR